MFNEAFWFFYWVGLAGSLTEVFIGLAILTGFSSLFIAGMAFIEDAEWAKRALPRVVVPIFFGSLFMAVIIPSETALYAGAGQYVAEAGEIDETIISLKKLLDQKIAELSESE